MALIECHECKRQISDAAEACPHCGAPRPAASIVQEPPTRSKEPEPSKLTVAQRKRIGCGTLILIGLGGLFGFGWLVNLSTGGRQNNPVAATAPSGAVGKLWDSAPTRDLKVFMPTTDEGLTLYVPKRPPAPLEGVAVKEADYSYDHRRLFAADFYIDGDEQSIMIKNALVKKYGTPQEADESAHSAKWSWPDQKVTIDMKYQASSKRTTITFAHDKRAEPVPVSRTASNLQETTALAAGTALKRAARNPDSIVVEYAGASEDGKLLCVDYRAQNGFGGMSRDMTAFQNGRPRQSASFWNQHCRSGLTDMTAVVKLGISMSQ